MRKLNYFSKIVAENFLVLLRFNHVAHRKKVWTIVGKWINYGWWLVYLLLQATLSDQKTLRLKQKTRAN